MLNVLVAIGATSLLPHVKPPVDAEGYCGYGATSLLPHVKPPVDAEGSCCYGATFVGAMLLLKVPLTIMGFSLLFFLIELLIIFLKAWLSIFLLMYLFLPLVTE